MRKSFDVSKGCGYRLLSGRLTYFKVKAEPSVRLKGGREDDQLHLLSTTPSHVRSKPGLGLVFFPTDSSRRWASYADERVQDVGIA